MQVSDALKALEQAKQAVEYQIANTPTSERRNQLTDANMNIMSAQEALRKLPAGQILFR